MVTARSTDEWIGTTPDTAPPKRVKLRRKTPNSPMTIDYFRERSVIGPDSGCWIWQGAIHSKNGYGMVKHNGRTTRAHRLAFIVETGETLTSDIDVCHRCDVRSCVNPAHLFAGSRTDNMRDCANKGRIRTPWLSGESCPSAKLTADQVRAIRADERSHRAVARAYGVDRGTVSLIRRGLTWRSI